MGFGLFNSNLLTLIFASGPVTKFVLLTLLALSIASWTVIFYKWRALRRAVMENRRFMVYFRVADDLAEVRRKAENHLDSPLAKVFVEMYSPLRPYLEPADNRGVSLRAVQTWLRTGVEKQILWLEEYLSFLATTGNVSPFIGLFGTVIGIMDSFQAIGLMGTANIAAVAPGVAEALVATAAGLFAAIPAVVAYNYYLGRIKILANEMETFSAEVINRVEGQMAGASVGV